MCVKASVPTGAPSYQCGLLEETLMFRRRVWWHYYYYYYRYGCLCHRHFFLVLLLNQRWSPLLSLQASHCSTFRIMCDVPSIAVFCSESIECFPGIVSKLSFSLLFQWLQLLLVQSYISGSTFVASIYLCIIIIIIIIIIIVIRIIDVGTSVDMKLCFSHWYE